MALTPSIATGEPVAMRRGADAGRSRGRAVRRETIETDMRPRIRAASIAA